MTTAIAYSKKTGVAQEIEEAECAARTDAACARKGCADGYGEEAAAAYWSKYNAVSRLRKLAMAMRPERLRRERERREQDQYRWKHPRDGLAIPPASELR